MWPQATHLWVVDSDILPAPDCLEKLLEVDQPVVGAYVPVAEGRIPIYMEGGIETRSASSTRGGTRTGGRRAGLGKRPSGPRLSRWRW